MRRETLTRARLLAHGALRISNGRFADAVALLAQRCRPSQVHTLARGLLLAAGSVDHQHQQGRSVDVAAHAAVALAAAAQRVR